VIWVAVAGLAGGLTAILAVLGALLLDAVRRDLARHRVVPPWVLDTEHAASKDLGNRVDDMRGLVPVVDNGQRRRKTDLATEIESWLQKQA
jgi:hypothetical protein